MTDIDKDYLVDEEEETLNIDFGKYWNRLKRHWKTILIWAAAGFALGCIIALATPRKFVCVSKLAPELSNTATNRLSSMASMMGLSATMLGTTDAVYPMVYPDLVHSPEFIVDLFDMPVDIVDKEDSVHTTLYDYMTNYYGKTTVGTIVGAPKALLGKIMDKIKNEEVEDTLAPYDPYCLTKKQGMVYKNLCKCIEAEIDRKTMVVTIKTSLDDRFICTDLAREVNTNIKKYVTRYRTEKAINDRDYYADMFEKAKKDYFDALYRYSRYMDTHQGMVLQSVKVESERLKNESNLNYQLYSTMAQQYQNAEAKVQQETPVFAEVVIPTMPFKSANSRKKIALAWALAALVVGAAVVLIKNREEEE